MTYRQRVIVILMTLSFGFLLTRGPVAAQPQAPFPVPDDPLFHDPAANLDPAARVGMGPHTAMERQEQEMEAQVDAAFPPQSDQMNATSAGQNTVSMQQLRHPLSRKGKTLLDKVQSYLKIGQRGKAKEQLAEAVKDESAAPYAHALLGVEYLRDGQVSAAIPELENAARILPMAGVHSNLGYALFLAGDGERGRREIEKALRLNGDSGTARFLMGLILLNRRSQEEEAVYNLKIAQSQVRSAHLALAVFHIRRGETKTAERELREFLGSKHQAEFPKVLQWASAAAQNPHPATAFGIPENASD